MEALGARSASRRASGIQHVCPTPVRRPKYSSAMGGGAAFAASKSSARERVPSLRVLTRLKHIGPVWKSSGIPRCMQVPPPWTMWSHTGGVGRTISKFRDCMLLLPVRAGRMAASRSATGRPKDSGSLGRRMGRLSRLSMSKWPRRNTG